MNIKVKIGFGGNNNVTVNTSASRINKVFDAHDADIVYRLLAFVAKEGCFKTNVNGITYSLETINV